MYNFFCFSIYRQIYRQKSSLPPLEVSSPFQPITPHHFRPHFPGSERATPCRYVHRLHQSRTCFFRASFLLQYRVARYFPLPFFGVAPCDLPATCPRKSPERRSPCRASFFKLTVLAQVLAFPQLIPCERLPAPFAAVFLSMSPQGSHTRAIRTLTAFQIDFSAFCFL